jgi:transposase
MLSFPPTVRVYTANEAVDMRKSYDGLSGCVEHLLHADPLSGHLFVFFNRRRTQVKILVWDRTGYCIYSKRLEQGRFYLPVDKSPSDLARLLLILEGIDLSESRQHKRFSLEKITQRDNLPVQ